MATAQVLLSDAASPADHSGLNTTATSSSSSSSSVGNGTASAAGGGVRQHGEFNLSVLGGGHPHFVPHHDSEYERQQQQQQQQHEEQQQQQHDIHDQQQLRAMLAASTSLLVSTGNLLSPALSRRGDVAAPRNTVQEVLLALSLAFQDATSSVRAAAVSVQRQSDGLVHVARSPSPASPASDCAGSCGEAVTTKAKLFVLDDISEAELIDAVAQVRNELALERIDSFILAPQFDSDAANRASTDRLWHAAESLYTAGVLGSIGVTNFDSADLSSFVSTAQISPSVNQISTGKFSQPLAQLAKQHNIALLSNPDAEIPILSSAALDSVIGSYVDPSGSSQLRPRWLVRYTTEIKCRSIAAHRGYILRADRV
ncbi:hypothetical protein CAOG_07784 [Capsaspora owczarzaki ATCC 30864]|uniref:GCS light chain n=1 Tax=Capsaspora owczarzaki (strain ATCC 30864) TaxID=595528 RepID=A0A0D2W0G0_CAPO3|nr:hypothetical protein CAOG_07784 [Capsaspora owczarzaki ATCC 30864]KJE97677.1 hypothetical protein CAOG_007784 [Capsaspora owczarzaki ATCC 30864]|eukprot:XP_004342857.2 hypothetical protein CAOG_07784 [Capsaspora owczarzaki ATCC 30864]